MAARTSGNLRNFDWDDTALINAYNEGLKEREMMRKGKKTSANKENVVRNQKGWKVGDSCRAKYTEDFRFYEAEIIDVSGEMITVKFIGYGDEQMVTEELLRPSNGKKARRRQREEARKELGLTKNEIVSESGGHTTTDCDETESQSVSSYKLKEQHAPQATYNYATVDSSFCPPAPPTAHLAVPAAVAPPAHNHSCCAVPPHNMNAPYLPAPPAPPVPQIPSLSNNPSMTAMLVSWYMAGYYTGLHQNQKDSQCSQRCCGHSNRCCH